MAITLGRKNNENGIRPLKPSQDLRGVASLIEEAFALDLDRSGRAALREMRMMGRWGFFLVWLDYTSPDVNTHLNGFVWVEDGQIVGNVTVSRNSPGARHWFISNVAVARSHRGQGIARALMDTAIEFVREMHGDLISLQVRRGNDAAIGLYRSLGFREISATSFLYLPTLKPVMPIPFPDGVRLREHRLNLDDSAAVYALAREAVPLKVQMQRPLRQSQFRIGTEINFQNFWRGLVGLSRVQHWVVEQNGGKMIASIGVVPGKWNSESRLSFIVHPDWWGQLEMPLLSTALTHLKNGPARPIAFQHPAEHIAGIEALESFGFTIRRTHIWMKFSL